MPIKITFKCKHCGQINEVTLPEDKKLREETIRVIKKHYPNLKSKIHIPPMEQDIKRLKVLSLPRKEKIGIKRLMR